MFFTGQQWWVLQWCYSYQKVCLPFLLSPQEGQRSGSATVYSVAMIIFSYALSTEHYAVWIWLCSHMCVFIWQDVEMIYFGCILCCYMCVCVYVCVCVCVCVCAWVCERERDYSRYLLWVYLQYIVCLQVRVSMLAACQLLLSHYIIIFVRGFVSLCTCKWGCDQLTWPRETCEVQQESETHP